MVCFEALFRWPIKMAVIIAVTCTVARTSFAESPHSLAPQKKIKASGFALQVSLRNRTKPPATTETEKPILEYRLMTTLDPDAPELTTNNSNSDRFGTLRLRVASQDKPLPHLLSWMEGWRMDIERGLFRPLRDHAFRLALAYSDIFETRSHPDKGGHGPGIVFRYDFRSPSAWR